MVKLLELLICRLYQLGNRITGVFHEASQSIKGGGKEPSIVGLCYLTNKLRDSQGIPYNQIFGRISRSRKEFTNDGIDLPQLWKRI